MFLLLVGEIQSQVALKDKKCVIVTICGMEYIPSSSFLIKSYFSLFYIHKRYIFLWTKFICLFIYNFFFFFFWLNYITFFLTLGVIVSCIVSYKGETLNHLPLRPLLYYLSIKEKLALQYINWLDECAILQITIRVKPYATAKNVKSIWYKY